MSESVQGDCAWRALKKRYHLSNRVIHMAKTLGFEPKQFDRLGNRAPSVFKKSISDVIQQLYAFRKKRCANKKGRA